MKLYRFFALLIAIFLTLFASTSVFAQQSKTPVCHITGTYDFGSGPIVTGHVITIADPALPSHIDHGDMTDYTQLSLPDGSIVCTTPDTDGDGVLNDVDACDNPAALAVLDSQEVDYTINYDGCIVINGTLPYGADLSGINLNGADLSGINLNGANVSGADLSGADLSGTTGAATGGSSPINADEANLSGANLTLTYLKGSSFVNANLSGALINQAYLIDVDFTGADLSGASFDNTYCPDGTFSGAGGTCVNNL